MVIRNAVLITAFLGLFLSLSSVSPSQDRSAGGEKTKQERPAVSTLIDRLDNKYLSTRKTARKKLVEAGASAVPSLMKAAKNGSFRVRQNSLIVLGKIRDDRAIPLLIRSYLDENLDIRAAARRAIQHFGARALDPMRMYIKKHPQQGKRLKDLKERMLRLRVEKTLMNEISEEGGGGFYDGQFNELKPLGPDVVPYLKKIALGEYEFLRSVPPHVREIRERGGFSSDPISRMAVEAMGVVGTDEQVPFLKKIVGDRPSTTGLKEAAAVALYRIGHKEPLRQLKDQLETQYKQAQNENRGLVLARYGNRYATILARMDREEEVIKVYKSLLNNDLSGNMPRSYKQLWWYNLACSYAQTNQKKNAMSALRKSVELGYRDHGWLSIDGDLDPIRGMSAFKKIKKKAKNKKPTIRTRVRPMIDEADEEENDKKEGAEENGDEE